MINLRVAAVTSFTLILYVSAPALADPRDDVLEAMGRCAAVTDDKSRLACYDALAPRLKDALNTPPATLSHPPTKEEQESWFGFDLGGLFGSAPAQQTTPEKFGADTIPQPEPQAAPSGPASTPAAEPQELDSITANVTDYSFTPFGKFIVFLDNGQVWRQMQGDDELAHFRKMAKDNTVTIERGALGSYNLHVNDSNKIFKVTRVK